MPNSKNTLLSYWAFHLRNEASMNERRAAEVLSILVEHAPRKAVATMLFTCFYSVQGDPPDLDLARKLTLRSRL